MGIEGNVTASKVIKGKISGAGKINGNINKLVELRGYSAYEVAVVEGFNGTEAEWLATLKGEKGDTGGIQSVNGIEADENGNVDIELPTKLPNPYALIINGTEYDGTKAINLVIEGGDSEAGNDGFSPIANVTQMSGGAVITITDKDGTTTATVTNGKDGKDGQSGKDGTSVSHKWNGTTLTVTSASGTSSANLKGDKGDDGNDYVLTEADKQEIASMLETNTYTKTEIDAMLGSYITDIDTLVGGDG